MYYQLSRLGICEVKQKNYNSQFGGSSVYECGNNYIFKKENRKKKPKELADIKTLHIKKQSSETKKTYKLKKTKIRNKILNFFALNASKKFCAFYSISFPLNINDDLAYQIFNTWLTRCRKDLGLKSYIWVAERQKNGTLHFHLLTNNFMPIKYANEYMRTALLTQYEKGNLEYSLYKLKKYNGVDVDNLYKSKRHKNKNNRVSKQEAQKKLSAYLTKYVSKNDTSSSRLPWHCSRDISALFIKINYVDVSENEIFQLIYDNPEAVSTYKEDFFTMHYFKFIPEEKYFSDLVEANNLIYSQYHLNC